MMYIHMHACLLSRASVPGSAGTSCVHSPPVTDLRKSLCCMSALVSAVSMYPRERHPVSLLHYAPAYWKPRVVVYSFRTVIEYSECARRESVWFSSNVLRKREGRESLSVCMRSSPLSREATEAPSLSRCFFTATRVPRRLVLPFLSFPERRKLKLASASSWLEASGHSKRMYTCRFAMGARCFSSAYWNQLS